MWQAPRPSRALRPLSSSRPCRRAKPTLPAQLQPGTAPETTCKHTLLLDSNSICSKKLSHVSLRTASVHVDDTRQEPRDDSRCINQCASTIASFTVLPCRQPASQKQPTTPPHAQGVSRHDTINPQALILSRPKCDPHAVLKYCHKVPRRGHISQSLALFGP
jgi:hypothetical protein